MIMAVLMSVSEELNVSADKLLCSIGEGDAESLAELYKLCGKAVYSYALAMTHNTYDAEDVLHVTFLSLCRSAKDYNSHGKAMAYIFTVTRNHCLDDVKDEFAAWFDGAKLEEIWYDDAKLMQISEKYWNDTSYGDYSYYEIVGIRVTTGADYNGNYGLEPNKEYDMYCILYNNSLINWKALAFVFE